MAAEEGHPEAQYNLALMYDAGRGVSQDQARAAHWHSKAGEVRAVKKLAYPARLSAKESASRALHRYLAAAEQGDQAAVDWLLDAAERGDLLVQAVVGAMFLKGLGVRQDYSEAARWLRMAAEQGDSGAQFALALQYQIGRGVPQNHAETIRWLRMAAKQGDSKAQAFLVRLTSASEDGC